MAASAALVSPPRVEATAASVERRAGADRYATAAAIGAATFRPGVSVAYVATGTSFPDSLAGGSRAGRQRLPILLTAPSELRLRHRTRSIPPPMPGQQQLVPEEGAPDGEIPFAP